jgi:hypothetical protein
MGTMASEADAFGIIIRFGGFRVHHARSHHYGSNRRHRSETRTASRAKPSREAKAEPTKAGTHYSGKDEIPAMARADSGPQKAADAAWQTYLNLPQAFRNAVGPVAIHTYASIADFRRIQQVYDANDTVEGLSTTVEMKDRKDFFCHVNLIPNMPSDMPSVLVHELGHCVDFRRKIGHSMPLMEAFFLDSTKETKDKLIEDGFGYFTTEPQEAFAQAISHYLVASVRIDYAKWEADWPHLNAHVRKLLDDAKIAYLDPKTKMTASEAPVNASINQPVPVAPLDY